MNKKQARLRRGLKTKAVIRLSNHPRLVVHRSSYNIYAQITQRGERGDLVMVSCSTLDKELKATLSGNKTEQATQVGKLLAQRAKDKDILHVAFDRSGNKYHGRLKALANGAREEGLIF